MLNKKFVSIFVLLAIVLFAGLQISPALAAAGMDDATATPVPVTTTPAAPITGTVQAVVINTDATTGTKTVSVTTVDSAGVTRTDEISLDAAIALGLVSLDAAGLPVVNDASNGTQITIDPAAIIAPPVTPVVDINPVGSAIALSFGLDPAVIAAAHDDGAGYGVIAQACWISYRIAGDASMCTAIIDAKKSGNLDSITLPDGTTVTYTNWGQFKKAYSDKGNHQNLGGIMSGHTDPILPTVTPVPGSTEMPVIDTTGITAGTGFGANQGNGQGNQGQTKPHGNNGHGNGKGNNPHMHP